MGSRYEYYHRPEYGSSSLLIEFVTGAEKDSFGSDLLDALKIINPRITEQMNLWMNDEFLYTLDSNEGRFELSKDIWGFAFIMARDNQTCISRISEILSKDNRFLKTEVDFAKYK